MLSLLNMSGVQDPRFVPTSDLDSLFYYVWLCSLVSIFYLIIDSARSVVARDGRRHSSLRTTTLPTTFLWLHLSSLDPFSLSLYIGPCTSLPNLPVLPSPRPLSASLKLLTGVRTPV